jgi:hypothetical protein
MFLLVAAVSSMVCHERRWHLLQAGRRPWPMTVPPYRTRFDREGQTTAGGRFTGA